MSFQVIHSILAPEALADILQRCYHLGKVNCVQFYSGGFNDTFVFSTTAGETYYLRVYRRLWRTADDIQYEMDVLNHLKQKGFPSIRPVADKAGHYFIPVDAPEGERQIAVFTEAKGKEITYTEDPLGMSFLYGSQVAKMHNALDDFQSDAKRFKKDIIHLIDTPLKNIEPFLANSPEQWHRLEGLGKKLKKKIIDLPAAGLEQGVLHGDLQGYHAKIDEQGTLTFFDFDCGGYGFRSYDLAVFEWVLRMDAFENRQERWTQYLAGYQSYRHLNQIDIEAVPYFVLCRYLWHMGVHTQNAADWGIGFLNETYFYKRIKTLEMTAAEFGL